MSTRNDGWLVLTHDVRRERLAARRRILRVLAERRLARLPVVTDVATEGAPMKWFARWRPLLRIARRDAWQHKGRSAVVLVMVALPVLGVVALDTLARTADVSTVEGLDRNLGTADAQVVYSGNAPIKQAPDRAQLRLRGRDPSVTTSPTPSASRASSLPCCRPAAARSRCCAAAPSTRPKLGTRHGGCASRRTSPTR